MKKKVLATVLSAVLAAGVLAGCGSSTDSASSADTTAAEAASEAATEAASEAATEAEASTELEPLTVAASETPHAEILEAAKDILAAEGYDLQVTVFDDYVQPNEVVYSGDIDANYFQHINYLESYDEEKGEDLVVAENGKIHYEPFGIYGGTKSDLTEIADGDAIAVPNDTTNEARALLLLQQEGLITLADGVGVTATKNDIVENPYNLEIVEVAAEQVSNTLPDVAFGVINGNYALQAGLNVANDALAIESADGDAIQQYVNVIAVKEGHESDPKIKALTDALLSDEIVSYINDNYDGAVVPYDGAQ